MNKRGDVFNLYFIVFVIILCGVVIASYINLQSEIKKVILSPEELLQLEDKLNILEQNEQIIMKELIKNGDMADVKKGLSLFCDKLEDYSNFLKEDTYYGGTHLSKEFLEAESNWDSFCKLIYDVSLEGDILSLKRDKITKKFRIDNLDRAEKKINFPIDVSFDYEKEYKFSLTTSEVIE